MAKHKNVHAVALGRVAGLAKSAAKARSSRANAKLPRKWVGASTDTISWRGRPGAGYDIDVRIHHGKGDRARQGQGCPNAIEQKRIRTVPDCARTHNH
jgi:hypothetical protein